MMFLIIARRELCYRIMSGQKCASAGCPSKAIKGILQVEDDYYSLGDKATFGDKR